MTARALRLPALLILGFAAVAASMALSADDSPVPTAVPAPAIMALTPDEGPVGSQVTISGQNLNGATKVIFSDNHPATFTVTSDVEIVATVPEGAVAGPISVETPGGTARSEDAFQVETMD